MREPSREFKTITDIIAAIVLILFFVDMVQWLWEMNRYYQADEEAGFIIMFYFWALLFAIIFFFSILYFFKNLIFERSTYTLSSKIIVLSVIAWLSVPVVKGLQTHAILSPLLIFFPIFIYLLSKKFLRWAKSENLIEDIESEERFIWRPHVSKDCADYYTYRVGWLAFLMSIVISFLLVFPMILGSFVDVSWVYYGKYRPQNIDYTLAFSTAFYGTFAFMAEFTLFLYLLAKNYAEDGVLGVFLLTGAFAYSPTYLVRHLGDYPLLTYGLVIILFIFALVLGVELMDEWMEHRKKEKSIDRRQWLTFR
jgi:hypothetical protein